MIPFLPPTLIDKYLLQLEEKGMLRDEMETIAQMCLDEKEEGSQG